MASSAGNNGVWGWGPFESDTGHDISCDILDSEDPAELIHELISESDDPRGKIDVLTGLTAIIMGALVTATDCHGEAVDVVRRCITTELLVQLRAKIIHAMYGPDSELVQMWSKDGELDEWRKECQVILEKWPH